MKILDRFILKSYLGPFLRSFLVILFLLVLQFLSRYKDDLFGKGISIGVLLELFGYASVSLVVLAFPASILLSSLFCMGSMGEYYETAALRSGGIRLTRILRPMLLATICIAIGSFLISVYVVPLANLKFYSRVYDIKQVKPTFTLIPGHFYNGIEGYTIRVTERSIERDMLYGVMIYDHTVLVENPEAARAARIASGIVEPRGGARRPNERREDLKVSSNNRLILADSGQMVIREDGLYMRMTLYNGVSHESLADELKGAPAGARQTLMPTQDRYARYYFDTLVYNFDLTSFSMRRTDEQAFSSHQYMLNLNELAAGMDSIRTLKDSVTTLLSREMSKTVHLDAKDTFASGASRQPFDLKGVTAKRGVDVLSLARSQAIVVRERVRQAILRQEEQEVSLREFQIEMHSRYLLPLACIIFLLIGAPLGSIIRKGGIGLPILFSIFFFVAFYLLLIQGKKMAREGVLEPWTGVWLPLFVMAPISLFITMEATNEARILNARVWWVVWTRFRAVLWYLNPLRFLVTLQFFRKALIALLEFLLSLSPAEIRRRRAIRRRAQSMRIIRGDKVEYVEREKKKGRDSGKT